MSIKMTKFYEKTKIRDYKLIFFIVNARIKTCGCGGMADTHGSGPCEETHAGSTPVNRTIICSGSLASLFK